MQTLHLIESAISQDTLSSQLKRMATENDALLFLNDSLYSLQALTLEQQQLVSIIGSRLIYALDEQIQSRGLDLLSDNKLVNLIDYATFVNLSAESTNVVSW